MTLPITQKMRDAYIVAETPEYETADALRDDVIRAVLDAIEIDDGMVERAARVIAPSSWAVFDGYLADVKRKYKGQDAAYDPDAFKDRKSMALARAAFAAALKGDE